MAQKFLIIDGYNLMHAAGMARERYGPGDLERCRERLLRFLNSHLTAEERKRTTIVFDAWDPPPGRERVYEFRSMSVIFADAPGEADAVIEELIAGHSAPRQVTIISGDRRLQIAASRRKAKFHESEAWLDHLGRRTEAVEREQPPPAPSSPEMSKEETEYWLKIFGDIDEISDKTPPSARQDLPDVIDEDYFD